MSKKIDYYVPPSTQKFSFVFWAVLATLGSVVLTVALLNQG